MIYITGDIHMDLDIKKLNKKMFPEGEHLTKDDYVIICGDFGLIWGGEYQVTCNWWLHWLERKPWTTLFVDGNHENHDLLNTYPILEWHGGKVHKINDSVIHLMRGEIYDIEGLKFFSFGGGFSHDIYYRTEGKSWWQNELPTQEEIDNALNNLEKYGNKVDIIITHDVPKEIYNHLGYYDVNMTPYDTKYKNLLTFLQYVKDNVDYGSWFAGHYHIDKDIEDFHILYYKFMKIELH